MRTRDSRLRALAPATAVLALLLAGCTDSGPVERGVPVPAERGTVPGEGPGVEAGSGDVVVKGRVVTAEGAGAAGVQVLLAREQLVQDAIGDLAIGGLTAGLTLLSCVDAAGAVVETCRQHGFTAATGADGAVALRLGPTELRSVYGGERRFTLTAPVPGGGTAAAVFPVDSTLVEVPALRGWAAAPAVAPAGDAHRATWTALPEGVATGPRFTAAFHDPDRGLVVERSGGATTAAVDARLLEDAAGTLMVRASARAVEAPEVELSWQSAPVSWSGTAGPAVSRSAPCSTSRHRLTTACWLTDGLFGTALGEDRPQECTTDDVGGQVCRPQPVEEVVVDLGRPVELGLLVVRGRCGECLVDVSADGREWALERHLDGQPEALLAVPPTAAYRYVRVRAEDGDAAALTELSAWAPTAAERAAAERAADAGLLGEVRGLPAGPVLVAGGMLLLVTGGLGTALVTRRRL